MRIRRLPRDFDDVTRALEVPETGVMLTVCDKTSTKTGRDPLAFGAAHIDIPLLATRSGELPRIASEYIEDALYALRAPEDCLTPEAVERITRRALSIESRAIPDVEKMVTRIVALELMGNVTRAAGLLGMAHVSLDRWFRRRSGKEP